MERDFGWVRFTIQYTKGWNFISIYRALCKIRNSSRLRLRDVFRIPFFSGFKCIWSYCWRKEALQVSCLCAFSSAEEIFSLTLSAMPRRQQMNRARRTYRWTSLRMMQQLNFFPLLPPFRGGHRRIRLRFWRYHRRSSWGSQRSRKRKTPKKNLTKHKGRRRRIGFSCRRSLSFLRKVNTFHSAK